MPDGHGSVLSVGSDSHLLTIRHEVLRQAGFNTFSTSSEEEALQLINEGRCPFLVLCHTLRESTRANLVEQFRKYCPQGRIIGVSNVPWPQTRDLDAVVYGVEGPDALIQAINGSQAA